MILYLCDRKKCEDCSAEDCMYTSDIAHALNFRWEHENYVEAGQSEREKLRKCTVNGKKAYFHKWEDFSAVVEASPLIGGAPAGCISRTFGIIEYEDGTVEKVKPTSIKFEV